MMETADIVIKGSWDTPAAAPAESTKRVSAEDSRQLAPRRLTDLFAPHRRCDGGAGRHRTDAAYPAQRRYCAGAMIFLSRILDRMFDRLAPALGRVPRHGGDRCGGNQIHRSHPAGRCQGPTVEAAEPELVAFEQQTDSGSLRIRIVYRISERATGVIVERTGEIRTSDLLALAHPLVVSAIPWEDRRTIKKLRAGLNATVGNRRPSSQSCLAA